MKLKILMTLLAISLLLPISYGSGYHNSYDYNSYYYDDFGYENYQDYSYNYNYQETGVVVIEVSDIHSNDQTNAHIELRGNVEFSTSTKDGLATFRIPTGGYDLFVEKNGYETHRGEVFVNSDKAKIHKVYLARPEKMERFHVNIQNSADVERSRSVILPVTIENTGDFSSSYNIRMSGLPSKWVEIPSVPRIGSGDSATANILIAPNVEASLGSHFATVSVSDGKTEKTERVSINVVSPTEDKEKENSRFLDTINDNYWLLPLWGWLLALALLAAIIYAIFAILPCKDPLRDEESFATVPSRAEEEVFNTPL